MVGKIVWSENFVGGKLFLAEILFVNFCLQITSSWVKLRLYTENQIPGGPGSDLKVCGGWVVVGGVETNFSVKLSSS